jgi:RHS repeat-associated protein
MYKSAKNIVKSMFPDIFLIKKTLSFYGLPPAGHYSFVYTPTFAGSTWTTSFAFNTNSSSTHTFIIDNITMCPINGGPQVLSYNADMLMHTDYYPFGQQMPARTWQGTSEGYRYSHNSHEKEDAIYKGAQSAEYWMYDSRIGRRWELDPLTYDWQSSYAAFNNNPIYFSDPLGLEGKGGDKGKSRGQKIEDNANKKSNTKDWVWNNETGKLEKAAPTGGAGNTPTPDKTPAKKEDAPTETYDMNKDAKPEAKSENLLSASNMNTQNGMYPGGKPTLPNKLSHMPFEEDEAVSVTRKVSKGLKAEINTNGDFSATGTYKTTYWNVGAKVNQNIDGSTKVDPKVSFNSSKLFLPEIGLGGERTVVEYMYVVKDDNFAVITPKGMESSPTRTVNGVAIVGKIAGGAFTSYHYSKYEMVTYSSGYTEGPYKLLDSADFKIGIPIKGPKKTTLNANITFSK